MKRFLFAGATLIQFMSACFGATTAKNYSCEFANAGKQIKSCSFDFPKSGQPEQYCEVKFSDQTQGYCSVSDGGFLGDQVFCVNKIGLELNPPSTLASTIKRHALSKEYRAATLAFAIDHGVFFVLQLPGADGEEINMQCNTIYQSGP